MKLKKDNVVRYQPDAKSGLSLEEVELRKKQNLINKTKIVVGKTYTDIIFSNIFNFFNILLFVIAGFMIYAGINSIFDLFFLFILVCNIAIGLYQDIKARILMGKLRLITTPKVRVVRGGVVTELVSKDLVLDDIFYIKADDQIAADSILIDGHVGVNESLLTGESDIIYKNAGDILYSGSFVVNGTGIARVDKVGKDNYIETIQNQANKFKRSSSQILKSLRKLFIFIGAVVITIGVASIIIFLTETNPLTEQAFKDSIKPLAGSLVGMIPTGLYLLTSAALAVGVISLAKKRAQVQDFYSIEMLSRTSVLCVDKTGTITDGSMELNKVIPLGKYSNTEISQIISNLLKATKDDNLTARALNKEFTYEMSAILIKALPFCSENKYSAASFKGNKTYILGAPEFINIDNRAGIIKLGEEYTSKGFRVLVLAESNGVIQADTYNDYSTAIALIVLQDHIKENAIRTFKWFSDNGVKIKIISGDNARTVSEIARQAEIPCFHEFISLEGMSNEEVANIANQYTVFGRVTPEQKEIIIQSLKNNHETVAMTGDGVNDILALKRADCSIAMATGAEAAKNVSHIVLLDSDFDTLPSIVGEGRRVINNLQRTCSLFLVKTIFAMVMSIVFMVAKLFDKSIYYPFVTNHLLIWEVVTIGMSAFFLALEKNDDQIKGNFLSNIFKKAIPAAIMILTSQLFVFIGYLLNKNGVIYLGIENFEQAQTMAILCFTILSVFVLFEVCLPFDKYRKTVFAAAVFFAVLFLILFMILDFNNPNPKSPILVNFYYMEGVNYFGVAMIVIVLATIYIFVNYLVKILKGDVKRNVKDK